MKNLLLFLSLFIATVWLAGCDFSSGPNHRQNDDVKGAKLDQEDDQKNVGEHGDSNSNSVDDESGETDYSTEDDEEAEGLHKATVESTLSFWNDNSFPAARAVADFNNKAQTANSNMREAYVEALVTYIIKSGAILFIDSNDTTVFVFTDHSTGAGNHSPVNFNKEDRPSILSTLAKMDPTVKALFAYVKEKTAYLTVLDLAQHWGISEF